LRGNASDGIEEEAGAAGQLAISAVEALRFMHGHRSPRPRLSHTLSHARCSDVRWCAAIALSAKSLSLLSRRAQSRGAPLN
jgi:hypothetical protein